VEKESLTLIEFYKFITNKKKVVSIIGLEKNVGKTTFLNFILEGLNGTNSNPLVLSIGRDGEKEDRLEETKKPRIKLYRGQYFLSIDSLLSSSASIEVLDSFGQIVSGSTLFLARAVADTYVEIINPGSIERVKELINSVQKDFNVSPVLIDGALDRKSHASSRVSDGIFICAGAQAEGTIEDILKKTQILVSRLEKKECEKNIKELINSDIEETGFMIIRDNAVVHSEKKTLLEAEKPEQLLKDGDTLYTTGILTNVVAKNILEKNIKVTIVVDDGTKIMLDTITEKRLQRNGVNLCLQYSVPVYGIILSSIGIRKSLNPSRLLSRFKEVFNDRLVLDLRFID
jgi:deoxycytidylate deaminase